MYVGIWIFICMATSTLAKTLPFYNIHCSGFPSVCWQQTWQQNWSSLITADHRWSPLMLLLMLRVTMTMTLTLTVQSRYTFAWPPAGPLLLVGRAKESIMIIFGNAAAPNTNPLLHGHCQSSIFDPIECKWKSQRQSELFPNFIYPLGYNKVPQLHKARVELYFTSNKSFVKFPKCVCLIFSHKA